MINRQNRHKPKTTMDLISFVVSLIAFAVFVSTYRFLMYETHDARSSLIASVLLTPLIMLLSSGLIQLISRFSRFFYRQLIETNHYLYLTAICLIVILINVVLQIVTTRRIKSEIDIQKIVQSVCLCYFCYRIFY